jgi:hypothetical protein
MSEQRMASRSAVGGGVRLVLRAEGLAALATSVLLYQHAGYSWRLFALCVLLPDLGFAGYLGGPRIGAAVYNVAHSYVTPIALAILCHLVGADASIRFSLIWIAHIGADRAMGYGLKYATAFGDTHLGRIGRSA